MFYLIGTNADGTDYRIPARNMRYFDMAIRELDADPSKELPTTITGTLSPERLPILLKQYLEEHNAVYRQDSDYQGRHINLYIRNDDRMPIEMGGHIFLFKGMTVININGNYGRIAQLAEFLHEATHLWRDDLNSPKDADTYKIEEDCKADLIAACKVILADAEKEGNM